MKTAPMVTVLLPVYNGDSHLKKAIKSIQKQSYKNWELILINDGSIDKSLIICEELIKEDRRIKLINNKKHLGLIKSLNLGLKLAKGKFIARQDADDISYRKRLEKQVKFLEKNPDYGLICSLFTVATQKQKILKVTALPINDYEIKLSMMFFNPITHGAVMLRKDTLKKFNLRYEEKDIFCEDYGLWLRMAPHTKYAIIDEPLYQWTISKNGITAKNLSIMEEKRKKLSKDIVEKIDLNKLSYLKKIYKNYDWSLNGKKYKIDRILMYQKLLFNLAKFELNKGHFKNSAIIFYLSISAQPKNYLNYFFYKLFRTKHLDKLALKELIK